MGVECPPYKTGYGFILGGGQLNSHNRIIGVEVPSRQANFDKIRQITILDLCKFLDLPKISSPDQYHSIQSLFLDAKKQFLGYYKCFDRNKSNSEDIQNLQLMFRESLDCMFAEKTNLYVMRAKLCEKALYLGFTKQRNKQYSTWLNKLENLDYSNRTILLFS